MIKTEFQFSSSPIVVSLHFRKMKINRQQFEHDITTNLYPNFQLIDRCQIFEIVVCASIRILRNFRTIFVWPKFFQSFFRYRIALEFALKLCTCVSCNNNQSKNKSLVKIITLAFGLLNTQRKYYKFMNYKLEKKQ